MTPRRLKPSITSMECWAKSWQAERNSATDICLWLELVLLDDGRLDGHTVVVPAGDIEVCSTPHSGSAGDEVLDGLVRGRWPHVRVSIGEGGRAVVEEAGACPRSFSNSLYGPCRFQRWSISGSRLGRTARMGNSVLGEIDGLVVIHVSCSSIMIHIQRSLFYKARTRDKQDIP